MGHAEWRVWIWKLLLSRGLVMAKSALSLGDVLSSLLNAVALPGAYGGNLYIALHTGDPGTTGDQTVNECAYAGPYARVAVVRDNTGAGFTTSTSTRSNAAEITFPTCTGGSETATYVSVGTASTGTGRVLYKGALSSSLAISNNITPRFIPSALQVTEA
jgi:hypothetical protein